MSTTSLFVEILIIGLQALVWVGLLICAKWNFSTIVEILEDYKEFSALFTTFLLSIAYVLGIFIDRLADNFYKIFRYSGRTNNLDLKVGEMRLHIMHNSEGIAKFLEYQRHRLRIARATVLNLLITSIAGIICYLRHSTSIKAFIVILIIVLAIIILGISILITGYIDKAQMSRLEEAYQITTTAKGTEKNA